MAKKKYGKPKPLQLPSLSVAQIDEVLDWMWNQREAFVSGAETSREMYRLARTEGLKNQWRYYTNAISAADYLFGKLREVQLRHQREQDKLEPSPN